MKPLFILTAIMAATAGATPPTSAEDFRIPCKDLDTLGHTAEDLILWPGVKRLELSISDVYGVDDSGKVVALPVPGAPVQTPAQVAVSPGNATPPAPTPPATPPTPPALPAPAASPFGAPAPAPSPFGP